MFVYFMKRVFSTTSVAAIVAVIVVGLIVIDYRFMKRSNSLAGSSLRSGDMRKKVFEVDAMMIILGKLDVMTKKIERLSNVIESNIKKPKGLKKGELNKNEITKNETIKNEITKNEAIKNEAIKNEITKNEAIKRGGDHGLVNKDETTKNLVNKDEIMKKLRANAESKQLRKVNKVTDLIKKDEPKSTKQSNGFNGVTKRGDFMEFLIKPEVEKKEDRTMSNPIKELLSLGSIIRNSDKERSERRKDERDQASSPSTTSLSPNGLQSKFDVLDFVKSKFDNTVDLTAGNHKKVEGVSYRNSPLFFHPIGELGSGSPFDNISNLTDFTGSISSTVVRSKEIPSDDSKEVKSKVTSKVTLDIERSPKSDKMSSVIPVNDEMSQISLRSDKMSSVIPVNDKMSPISLRSDEKSEIRSPVNDKMSSGVPVNDKMNPISLRNGKMRSVIPENDKMSEIILRSDKMSDINLRSDKMNKEEYKLEDIVKESIENENSKKSDKHLSKPLEETKVTDLSKPLEETKVTDLSKPLEETKATDLSKPLEETKVTDLSKKSSDKDKSLDNFNEKVINSIIETKTDNNLQLDMDRQIEKEHLQKDKEKRENSLLNDFEQMEKELSRKNEINKNKSKKITQTPISLSLGQMIPKRHPRKDKFDIIKEIYKGKNTLSPSSPEKIKKEIKRKPEEVTKNSDEQMKTPQEVMKNSDEQMKTPQKVMKNSDEQIKTPQEEIKQSLEDTKKPEEEKTKKEKEKPKNTSGKTFFDSNKSSQNVTPVRPFSLNKILGPFPKKNDPSNINSPDDINEASYSSSSTKNEESLNNLDDSNIIGKALKVQ